MLIIHHIIITGIIGFIFFFTGGMTLSEVFLFIIAGIFIDVDHIPSYWYYTRDFSLNYEKIKNWCFQIGYLMEHFFLLHTIWFVIILFYFRNVSPYTRILFWGVLLHVSLDIFYDLYWHYILKKNKRPYRRWIAPVSWLKTVKLEKYL